MVAQADVLIMGGLTDVDAFRSMVALLFHVELAHGGMLALRDGGEAVPAGLITRRSQVRLLLPQPVLRCPTNVNELLIDVELVVGLHPLQAGLIPPSLASRNPSCCRNCRKPIPRPAIKLFRIGNHINHLTSDSASNLLARFHPRATKHLSLIHISEPTRPY